MTTKKKTRPYRAAKNDRPRFTTNKPALALPEESTEQNWIVFALGLFVLLGIGCISAISYILLIG